MLKIQMIKLLSLFTGIGAFEKALKNLNIPYELVGFSEIDKYAIKSYCNIHNETEDKNLGDIKQIKTEDLPKEIDIMTWGFPCQDISIAGKLKGIEKGITRSGLYFEGYRILKDVMPKISIIENVKNLTSKRFKNEFLSILKDIEDLGYNNYCRVLNAKDFNIPQNRERVFIISIRKDIDKHSFKFPDKQFLKIRLKDVLEKNVDEKYYLSEKALGRLIKYSNKIITKPQNPIVSACLVANYFKMGARDQQYIQDDKVKRIIGVYDEDGKEHQAGSVYDEKGIAPTLTHANGGNIQPHIFVKQGTILTSPQIMPIVTSGNFKPNIAENMKIKMYNLYNNKEITDVAPTQTSNCGNIYSTAAVLITEDKQYCFRVRKLTPRECWRLMRFFR